MTIDVTVLHNKSHAAPRVVFGTRRTYDHFGDSRDPGHQTDSGHNVELTLVLETPPLIELQLRPRNLDAF